MNLKELSESLGLSMTTVSRGLSGYRDVSEKTRARVREAADACGYRPNPVARNLALGRSDVSAVMLAALSAVLDEVNDPDRDSVLSPAVHQQVIDAIDFAEGRLNAKT